MINSSAKSWESAPWSSNSNQVYSVEGADAVIQSAEDSAQVLLSGTSGWLSDRKPQASGQAGLTPKTGVLLLQKARYPMDISLF